MKIGIFGNTAENWLARVSENIRLKWSFRETQSDKAKSNVEHPVEMGQLVMVPIFAQARKWGNDFGNGHDFILQPFSHTILAKLLRRENELTQIFRENKLSKSPKGTRAMRLVPNDLGEKVRTTKISSPRHDFWLPICAEI